MAEQSSALGKRALEEVAEESAAKRAKADETTDLEQENELHEDGQDEQDEDEDGQDEEEDGQDEEEDDDDDDGNDGENVDLTTPVLKLSEPPFKKAFLRDIIARAAQFTELDVDGDWEAYLGDLKFIVPHLTNLTSVEMNAPQSGCEGVDEVVQKLSALPYIEYLDLGASYDSEPAEALKQWLTKPNALRTLKWELMEEEDADDFRSFMKALADGLRCGASRLEELEGVSLSDYLEELGFSEAEREELSESENDEILRRLRAPDTK